MNQSTAENGDKKGKHTRSSHASSAGIPGIKGKNMRRGSRNMKMGNAMAATISIPRTSDAYFLTVTE
jgi:hypothetical protein